VNALKTFLKLVSKNFKRYERTKKKAVGSRRCSCVCREEREKSFSLESRWQRRTSAYYSTPVVVVVRRGAVLSTDKCRKTFFEAIFRVFVVERKRLISKALLWRKLRRTRGFLLPQSDVFTSKTPCASIIVRVPVEDSQSSASWVFFV
jgi:hypothetical protein